MGPISEWMAGDSGFLISKIDEDDVEPDTKICVLNVAGAMSLAGHLLTSL